MSHIEEVFNSNLKALLRDDTDSLCVAVSGGSDSMALLFLAKQYCDLHGLSLFAITVDHMLRDESHKEALHVHDVCRSISIEHIIIQWQHGNIPVGRLENSARNARYSLMTEECAKRNVRYLLVGHNADEQLETFFLRKQMCSSEFGLACMSMKRSINCGIQLLRPCLSFSKKTLRQYLKEQNISWFEDIMNDDLNFMRVRFRKIVNSLSSLERTSILNQIMQFGLKRSESERKSTRFLQDYCAIDPNGFAQLDRVKFDNLHYDIRCDVLKRSIRCISHEQYNISQLTCNAILDSHKRYACSKIVVQKDKNSIIIYRENRHFEKENFLNADEVKIWDKRYKIRSFCNGLHVSAFQKYVNLLSLPSYIVASLPVFRIENGDVHVGFNDNPSLGFTCEFLKTEDFLDVFCAVENIGDIL